LSTTKTTLLPVLTAMILTTAYAVLSEYDDKTHQSFSSSSNVITGDTRPLLRNCVRTIIDLGSLPTFLEEIIIVASARFDKEGQWWSSALSESRKCTPEYLLHVEKRLRQSAVLTNYYLPSNDNAVACAALVRLAKLSCLGGLVPSPSPPVGSPAKKKVVWETIDNTTRRILPAIIERQLLSPLLAPGGILEPRHLYPMLDDDDGSGSDAWKTHNAGSKTYDNAKRLYGLCWRIAVSSPPPARQTRSNNPSGGIAPSSSSQSALDHLRIAFGEYGRLRGSEIIKQGLLSPNSNNNKEMEKKVIPDLLAFKNHLNSLHAIAFRSDEAYGAMVRSILEDVLNGSSVSNDDDGGDGGRRIAELLAKHVDGRFKDAKAQASSAPSAAAAGGGGTSSMMPGGGINLVAAAIATDANESFQNEILALFRHVNSKDVFEAFYKRDLAKRLLTGRAVSTDMERSFLSKLKAECGAGYTSKMEGMFKDMDLSRDIMGSYAAYCSSDRGADAGGGKAVDMDVQVLTTGYWPVYPKYEKIILPSELLLLRSKFEKYYNDKYQGRRIAWQYSLGNCIVKASFPKCPAPKELIVNVCQSLVLLCFQNEDGPDGLGLTLDDITKRTGIEDRNELERVLQSLSMGREGTRVLKKVDYNSPTMKSSEAPSSPSKDGGGDDGSPRKSKKVRVRRNVNEFDRFLFNPSFTSNQRRIRITNITMKETTEERAKTHETVSKDRLYLIDAAVVRIMKARKIIDHRGLIGEVMAQLKFPATSADIKKRIESLIEREYMERVEGDRSRYKYLA
jgi:cullin-4